MRNAVPAALAFESKSHRYGVFIALRSFRLLFVRGGDLLRAGAEILEHIRDGVAREVCLEALLNAFEHAVEAAVDIAADGALRVRALVEVEERVAAAHQQALDFLRTAKDTQWTYISPAGDFQAEGERTGKYILAGEEFTLNSRNESIISYADYAIALVDEIEKGGHSQQRISVVRA